MAIYMITWNIKAGQIYDGTYPSPKTANLDSIANAIKNSGASIASLQEVDAYTQRSGTGIHQAEYITNKLTAITGVTWYYKYITSKNMNPGYYGNAIVSRYPLTTILRVYMPKVNGAEDRSFLLVRADFGSTFLYAGTFHLGLNGDQPIHAQQIKDALGNSPYSNDKLIIGGDLNDKQVSDFGYKTYDIMLWNVFPMADTGPGGVCTINCWPNAPGERKKIDFWFKRGVSVDAARSQVLSIDISDHRPVLAYVFTG